MISLVLPLYPQVKLAAEGKKQTNQHAHNTNAVISANKMR